MVFKKSCGSQGGIHQPPSFSSHHHPSSPSSFPLDNLSAGSQNTLKTSLQVSSVLKSTPKQSCHFLHCLASPVRVIGPGTGLLIINIKKQKCLPALSCPSPKPILFPKDILCHVWNISFHIYRLYVTMTHTHHCVSVTVLSILHILSHLIFTTHEVDIMMMPILLYKYENGGTEMLTHLVHKNTLKKITVVFC